MPRSGETRAAAKDPAENYGHRLTDVSKFLEAHDFEQILGKSAGPALSSRANGYLTVKLTLCPNIAALVLGERSMESTRRESA
jgi:hypothetical protein